MRFFILIALLPFVNACVFQQLTQEQPLTQIEPSIATEETTTVSETNEPSDVKLAETPHTSSEQSQLLSSENKQHQEHSELYARDISLSQTLALLLTPEKSIEKKEVNNSDAATRSASSEKPEVKEVDLLQDRLVNGFKLDLTLSNKRIDAQKRWFLKHPEYLRRTFNRSNRYLFHIVEEAEKRGVPLELALLPLVESAFDPFAYSHGRASGLWQFIPGTGRIYGLKQDWWYDGRRDVLASTKAGLDYLEHLAKIFNGNWLHALAAYNSGSGTVSKAIRRNKKKGKPTDFWSLKLPRETRAYVPKLLAICQVVKEARSQGTPLPALKNEAYFSVVKLDSQIDLAQAAKLAEVDIEEIYKLNPGFSQWATSPIGPHRLLVPKEQAEVFANNLANLPEDQRLTWKRYNVKRGDALISIAKRFQTTPQVIKQVNRIRGSMIRENQKLLIPIASKSSSFYDLSANNRLATKQGKIKGAKGSIKIRHKVRAGDTMWDLSREHKVSVRSIAKWNGMAPGDVLKPGMNLVIWSKKNIQQVAVSTPPQFNSRQMIKKVGYKVRRGDSLARIANKFKVSVRDLLVWNKLDRKKYLQPGQRLTIFVDISKG